MFCYLSVKPPSFILTYLLLDSNSTDEETGLHLLTADTGPALMNMLVNIIIMVVHDRSDQMEAVQYDPI